jgi:type III pantothenate kinase
VVDTGTCIKYNFINNKNEYIGGAISPGLQMRFKSLNSFTSRLPLLDVEENFNTLIGTNSKDNILSGVELGAVAEINSFIDQYKQLYPDINVVLSGGDVNFFEKRLKKPIFAEPYLILKGLNNILNHCLKISHL